MTQESCPRCFAPPGEAGRPGCACATRAGIAGTILTDPAEQAGDSDQLHVRPYVTLGHETEAPEFVAEPRGEERPAPAGRPRTVKEPASVRDTSGGGPATTRLPTVVRGEAPEATAGDNDDGNDNSESAGVADAGRGAGGAAGVAGAGTSGDDEPDEPPVRRRKGVYLAVAIAVVAAVVALSAGVAVRGGGADEAVGPGPTAPTARAALPGATGTADDKTSPTPGSSASDAASTPSDEPSGSPSDKASASVSASASSAKGAAAEDTPASPTASAPPTGSPSAGTTPSGPAVLRRGDTGPEVVELQKRMSQLLLRYLGMPDGTYDAELELAVARYQDDRDITGDPSGVYGPATRKVLEAETEKP